MTLRYIVVYMKFICLWYQIFIYISYIYTIHTIYIHILVVCTFNFIVLMSILWTGPYLSIGYIDCSRLARTTIIKNLNLYYFGVLGIIWELFDFIWKLINFRNIIWCAPRPIFQQLYLLRFNIKNLKITRASVSTFNWLLQILQKIITLIFKSVQYFKQFQGETSQSPKDLAPALARN